jgi:hypothetical protein
MASREQTQPDRDATPVTIRRLSPDPFGGGPDLPDESLAAGATDPPLLDGPALARRLRAAAVEAAVPLHPAQESSLEQLATPNSAVVLCVQWPRFLGGPLEQLYTALRTIARARLLSERRGTAVVPLAWIASEDAPLAELHAADVLNRHLDLARVGLAGLGASTRSAARLPLDDAHHRVTAVRANLRHLLAPGPDRDRWLAAFTPGPGDSLAGAFRRGASALLGPLGLLFVEPHDLGDSWTPDPAALLRGQQWSRWLPLAEGVHRPSSGTSAPPRAGAITLLSPAVRQALGRAGTTVEAVLTELQAGRPALPEPAGEEEAMPPVIPLLRTLNTQKCAELRAHQPSLAEVDRGLAIQFKRAAREAEERIEEVLRKAERVHRNRRGKERRHGRRLANTLFGRGRPQQQTLTAVQYLAAFGDRWVHGLAAAIDPSGGDHLLVEFQGPPELGE